jgi:hypothetical protein
MSVKEAFMYIVYFFTTKNVMCNMDKRFLFLFFAPNHMALGRGGPY